MVGNANKFTSVYNLSIITEELVQLNHRMDTTDLIQGVSEALKGSCGEVVNGSDGLLCLEAAKEVVGMGKVKESGVENCVNVAEGIAGN